MKRSRVQCRQQFMCASLQRRTFKLHTPRGVRRIMHIHPSQRNMRRKKGKKKQKHTQHCASLIYFTARHDSPPIKGFHVPKQNLKPNMHPYLTADHWDDCLYSTLLLPPSCSISAPHCEAAGYDNNFYMDQCQMTGKIGCDLPGIGTI